MLFEALVTRKTVTVGEKLILPYKLAEVCMLCLVLRETLGLAFGAPKWDWNAHLTLVELLLAFIYLCETKQM